VGNRAERLLAWAKAYREAVLGGSIDVTKEPETPDEVARLFQFKREMIQGLVTRVDVLPDKSITVTFDLDSAKLLAASGLCIGDERVYLQTV